LERERIESQVAESELRRGKNRKEGLSPKELEKGKKRHKRKSFKRVMTGALDSILGKDSRKNRVCLSYPKKGGNPTGES